MKKAFITASIVALFLFGINTQSKATHFAGSDLTYTCLGGNTYLITFIFYRDCSGVPASPNHQIDFHCSSNPSFNFTATLAFISGSEVTQGCSSVPTTCQYYTSFNTTSSIGTYGIEEHIYQVTVSLPPCNSWTMTTNSCCRNNANTVTGSTSNPWAMSAILNNQIAPCNSSPTFSNKPIAIVCLNQSFCFNHGAIDPDGDSLSYSFYTPFSTSINNYISYVPGYNMQNFLPSNPPISLDPVTGDICFTPTQIITTITGIKVDEWRNINGVATNIGTIHRDIQMKVTYCSNQIPTLSGMDTLLTKTYNPNDTIFFKEYCLSSDSIIFHINGNDSDVYDPTNIGSPEIFSLNWNNGIPGGTFTAHHNQTDSAYAVFSWLPTAADVSNTPKCFTVTVTDEACPYYGSQTFSYCLVIRGMLVEIGTDTLLCQGESIVVNAIADTSTVNYVWTMNGVPTGTPLNQSSITINSATMTTGMNVLAIETNDGSTTMACPGVDAININVVYQPDINGNLLDSAFCHPGAITYDAGQGTIYNWTDFSGAPVGNAQTYTTSTSGVYSVYVDGGNNTRCTDNDTFTVISLETPLLFDTCIWQTDAPFLLDAGISSSAAYIWNTGATTQTINITESGTYEVGIYHPTISPSVKCSSSGIVNVIDQTTIIESIPYQSTMHEPMPDAIWQAGDVKVCTFQRVRFRGPLAPTGHSYSYIWSKAGNVVSTSDFFFFSEEVAGEYELMLNVGGCKDKIIVEAENCEVTVPNIITPNGDPTNQTFRIVLKENGNDFFTTFPNSTIIIYNRWGKKVYESHNYHNDWDGDKLADGVYFWNLYLADSKETKMNGTVTILR